MGVGPGKAAATPQYVKLARVIRDKIFRRMKAWRPLACCRIGKQAQPFHGRRQAGAGDAGRTGMYADPGHGLRAPREPGPARLTLGGSLRVLPARHRLGAPGVRPLRAAPPCQSDRAQEKSSSLVGCSYLREILWGAGSLSR
jgi:hypothetical protein